MHLGNHINLNEEAALESSTLNLSDVTGVNL